MDEHAPSELEALTRAVLDDLDGAAALADLADEVDGPTAPYLSGRPSPSRGTLLRRRMKMWQRERWSAPHRAQMLYDDCGDPEAPGFRLEDFRDGIIRGADNAFREYIRDRFLPKFLRV